MRTFWFALLALPLLHARVTEYELLPYDSVADPAATVVRGNARFTVLSPYLIRMEQSKTESTQFEDRATLAMVNRKVPVPPFNTSDGTDGTLTIATAAGVTLRYVLGKPFAADTLSVTFEKDLDGTAATWKYGDRFDGNLLGTIKSLDQLGAISLNCTENNGTLVHEETLHCEWGVVSRDGFSIYDDTQNYCLGAGDWWDGDSAASKNVDALDLYGFFHGMRYKQAVQDLTLVGGRVAMVPRAASGIWWTRWFDYNDHDALAVADKYRSHSFPLDVFVLDMDWHRKNSWTGYSFDNSLFPDEFAFMGALHAEGLYLAANLHDDVGIGPWENDYPYMRQLMGTPNGTNVPFTMCTNTTYTFGVEDVVLGSLEDGRIGGKASAGGMDFWWIDWQQGGNHGGCAGLKQNPTIWTNKIRCTDAKRRGSTGRNMVLARWGGMGTHRYQVGFSGDVLKLSWENLAYQPYFSLTSANVAYSYWSHDIEGPSADYEMYTRWVQWAAVSPVFRSHERGMSGGGCADQLQPGQARSMCSIVEPWNVPQQYADANRHAMRARAELVPYIYTAARAAYDTGVGLIKPMYYETPNLDGAYGATPQGDFAQYYFGPDMIAAPVVRQSANNSAPAPWATGMTANVSVWLPPGAWVERDTGAVHVVDGGKRASDGLVLTKSYDLSETPVFVRGGGVIPSIELVDGDTLGVAARQYTKLRFDVYPGAKAGAARVYEDDGTTTAYATDDSAYDYVSASFATDNGDGTTLTFNAEIEGGKAGSATPASRAYTLRLRSAFPPKSVTVNGALALHTHARSRGRATPAGSAPTWTYCGVEMAVVIDIPQQASTAALKVVVTTTGGTFEANAAALAGAKGTVSHAILAKAALDVARVTVGAHVPANDYLKKLSSAGSALAYAAAKAPRDAGASFAALVQALPKMLSDAQAEVAGMKPGSNVGSSNSDGTTPARLSYAAALLNSVAVGSNSF